MIVKVQISLRTTAAEPQVLVTDRRGAFAVQLPLSACVGLVAEMKGAKRAFFEAALIDDKLHLGRRVKEQSW